MKRRIIQLAILCLGTYALLAQNTHIRFEHLDSRDGLSHNRVTSIYKDQLGFMWFGTLSGLNRFDGTEIRVLNYDESDPYSLLNSNITWIKEGPDGYIWIKTSDGVFAYDIFREAFADITGILSDLQINNYNLSDLAKDSLGNYWFVIDDIGVKKYITDQQTIYHYGGAYRDVTSVQPDRNGNMALIHLNGEIELVNIADPRKISFLSYPEHIKNTQDLTAYIDSDGDYWFYSSSYSFGACLYRPDQKTCRHFGEKELGSSLVTGVIQDQAERVVVGVDHGGLTLIDKDDWSRQNFMNNPSDPKSLSHNSIISLYLDHSGLVWIGTHKGGVNYYTPKSVSFNFYKQANARSANSNDIWPLVEDGKDHLWIGTDGGGLSHFNRRTGTFKNYLHDINDPNSISSDIVVSLSPGADGGLWLGTYFGGLNYFDGKRFRHYLRDPEDPNSISDNSVWMLTLDSKKNLWVGTLKGGVDVYDPDFKKIYHLGLDNQGIHSNYITSFCEDKLGKMWIGTGYGLEVFDPETGKCTHLLKREGSPATLSNNSILDIFCDSQNDMWIGTMYGLNRYKRSTGEFESYTKSDGLPENIVTSILEDNQGTLWFSTYKGLSKMAYEDGKAIFHNFDISDGLQGDIFNERSSLRLSNGDLAFGGKNGLNIFNPEEVDATDEPSKLVFLDFYISNHQIKPGAEYNGRKWFENGINNTEAIVLEPDENSFTVEFTSLSFYQPENMVYKYRLVGFDEDWVVRSNVHRANYTNLDPGKYRFEVMATDQSHRWDSKPITLDIQILTPFWQTPLAILIYAVMVVIGLLLTRRAIIQKERYRARVEQERVEANRVHELDLMKIKFFTNISHEFRTPLTLIITPMERLLKTAESRYQNDFQMIHRNARRLLTLVNQLLDFRKIEANQHHLSISSGDLVEFMRSIVDSFSDLANDRNIKLEFKSEISSFFTAFDRDKFEKIMFNLLSNAFKFTHTSGRVAVEIYEKDREGDLHTIGFRVIDDGIGIPLDKQKDIFKRFFQVDNSQSLNINHGSGIGLSITKEFVEMHGGSIWVESTTEKGSTFIFELPLKKLDALSEDVVSEWVDEFPEDQELSATKATIVLADDNHDFRFYLKDNLKQLYNVIEAPNGKVAFKKILANPPDLVVTDIMMPEMNGVDLCKKIKSDPRSAHVPVILLTAHYSDDQKMEGFDAGAIEYITKPFNFEILIRSIKSAIQLQKLIHAAEHRVEAKPSDIEITSLDEKLITKALQVVEDNISNADFSVQELSRELAVSRGQLYKKILEITGITPIEFIRTIRLKRAAALLEKSQLTVAEVAYKVGFNNPKYFAKYFKNEYKVIPSKYVGERESVLNK